MAKWTLSDFIEQARTRLDEYDEETFSDIELTDYLNEAIQKMGIALKKETISVITINSKQIVDFREIFVSDSQKLITDYTQRTHQFLQLHSLYLNGTKLDVITSEEALSGKEGFYFFGDSINFNSAKTGELRALYIKQPAFLSNSTDVSDVPDMYQQIPLGYMIAKAKQKDEEYGLYDYELNRFESDVNKMESEINQRDNATGISTITISDYEG
jgi:hypothetical protein